MSQDRRETQKNQNKPVGLATKLSRKTRQRNKERLKRGKKTGKDGEQAGFQGEVPNEKHLVGPHLQDPKSKVIRKAPNVRISNREFSSRTDPLLLFRMTGKGQPLALRKTTRPTIRKTLTTTKSLESVRWTIEVGFLFEHQPSCSL
jgi:hypothetical protein